MNSTSAVEIENLSKRYVLGGTNEVGYKTIREGISRLARSPRRRRWDRQASPNEIWALRNVTFDVSEGEVLGIIGRNGAGKSTLLKILSRITEPTSGRTRIRGRVASLLEIGTGFHPELTGRENIYLNGSILGMTRAEIHQSFDAIVAFAEIEKFLDTPVKRYSSGIYMRLAFAIAAHLEPEILLIDEVLAVGDAGFQQRCLRKIGDAAKGGRTVVFVSHNLQAIQKLCPKAVWLREGQVILSGSSGEVVNRYMQDALETDATLDIAKVISQLSPDAVFQLKDVAIVQDHSRHRCLSNGKPVEIEICYRVFKESLGLNVYFLLYDLDGTLLFESHHNGDVAEAPLVTAGTYISRAIIPADFLAPRSYQLQVAATIAGVRSLMPHPISITLDIHSSGRVNQAYPGYVTPGKLAPLIEWNTTILSDNSCSS